jgi:hypothetical protein
MRRLIFAIFLSLSLCGCFLCGPSDPSDPHNPHNPSAEEAPDNKPHPANVIDCPEEIANRAFDFAVLYSKADTEYVWGGQDPLRAIQLDCSGLVIRCYQYALEGTEYKLLLPDMASSYMCESASTHVLLEDMRHGDLLFMGDKGKGKTVNHIAIFDCIEDGRIYFIDCTNTVNKVSRRSYPVDDTHFKYFGMMLVKAR